MISSSWMNSTMRRQNRTSIFFWYYPPKIFLGLTATPERMDNLDILGYFDGRIAAEIRLTEAIDRNLLSPFHYSVWRIRSISTMSSGHGEDITKQSCRNGIREMISGRIRSPVAPEICE